MRRFAVLLIAALVFLAAAVQAADPAASASSETAAADAAAVSTPQAASTPAAAAATATPTNSAAQASGSSSSSSSSAAGSNATASAPAAQAQSFGSEAEVVTFLDELMGLAQSAKTKPSSKHQQKHPALDWDEQDANADEDRHAAHGRRSSEEHRAGPADGSRHSQGQQHRSDARNNAPAGPHGRYSQAYREHEREAEAPQYGREQYPPRAGDWGYERPAEQPHPVSVCLQEDQRDNCWSSQDSEHFRSRVHCCQQDRAPAGAASTAGVQVAGRSELVHPWGADHACSWDFRPFKVPVPVNAITMQTGTAVAHCSFAKAVAVCGEPFEDGATFTIEADTFTMRAVSRPPLATERVGSCAAADKPSTPGKLETASASAGEGTSATAAAAAAAQPAVKAAASVNSVSSGQGPAISVSAARSDRVQWVSAASKQARKQQAVVHSYLGQYVKRYRAPREHYAKEKPYPWLAHNSGYEQPSYNKDDPYHNNEPKYNKEPYAPKPPQYNEEPYAPSPPQYNATEPYPEEEEEEPFWFPSYEGGNKTGGGDSYYHDPAKKEYTAPAEPRHDEYAPEEDDDLFFPGAERQYLRHSEARDGYKGKEAPPEAREGDTGKEAPPEAREGDKGKEAPPEARKGDKGKEAPPEALYDFFFHKKTPGGHYKKAPDAHEGYKQAPEGHYKKAPEGHYKQQPEGHYKQQPEAREGHYKKAPEAPYLAAPYPGYSGTGSRHPYKEEEAAVEDGLYLGWADVYVGRVVAAHGLSQGYELSGESSVQYVASFHQSERVTPALLRADPEFEALPFMKAGEYTIELQA